MLNAFDAMTLNHKIYFCLNSNEDIHTDQQPQQLIQDVDLEGLGRFFQSI